MKSFERLINRARKLTENRVSKLKYFGLSKNRTQRLSMLHEFENRIKNLESTVIQTNQTVKDVIRYSMKAHWRAINLIDKYHETYKPKKCTFVIIRQILIALS